MADDSPPSQTIAGWRDADHEQRRDLIIDVAMDLLHRRGLEAVTMRHVAGGLGVGAMTLYTYVSGQEDLRLEMARRGFDLLNAACEDASTLDAPGSAADKWRGGARAYLQFAVDHPNLYDLMFHVHPSQGGWDDQLLHGGFERFLERVREQHQDPDLSEHEREQKARMLAERLFIALHGLASLAIAGRLAVLGGDTDQLLDDLLHHIARD